MKIQEQRSKIKDSMKLKTKINEIDINDPRTQLKLKISPRCK